MTYLTYSEFKEHLPGTEITEDQFDKLLPKTSDVIDSITRHFYQYHDLSDDVKFRRTQFKKAVACQIEYFHDIGATSTHQLNRPLTVNVGRTQVMTGVENQRRVNSIISADVYMYLQGTGLLYRGLG